MNGKPLKKKLFLAAGLLSVAALACDLFSPQPLSVADVLTTLREAGYDVGRPEPDNYFHDKAQEGVHAEANSAYIMVFSFKNRDAAVRARSEVEGEKAAALLNPAGVLLGTDRGMRSSPGPEWHTFVKKNVLIIAITRDRKAAETLFKVFA